MLGTPQGVPNWDILMENTPLCVCSNHLHWIFSLLGKNKFKKKICTVDPQIWSPRNPSGCPKLRPLKGKLYIRPCVSVVHLSTLNIYSFFLARINLQKNSAQGTHKYGGSPILQMEFSPNKTGKWVLFGLSLYLSLQVWSVLRIRSLWRIGSGSGVLSLKIRQNL